MKRILAAANVELLAQFAWAHSVVAFDYDGTLAPTVDDRDQAFMRPQTHALLRRVAELYPTVVISGRGRVDMEKRLDGIAIRHVIGNHGIEPIDSMAVFDTEMRAILPALRADLDNRQGIDIEDKKYSLAIHYRRARRKNEARAAIIEAIAQLGKPTRTMLGKLVVNVLAENAPHKGDALIALRQRENADIALYVGDDATDEDVFELDQPGRLLCIRVGHCKNSAAPWYLRDQREVDSLLEKLVQLRMKGQTT